MQLHNIKLPIADIRETAEIIHSLIISNINYCKNVAMSPSLVTLLSVMVGEKYETLNLPSNFPNPLSPRLKLKEGDLTIYCDIYAYDHYLEFFKDSLNNCTEKYVIENGLEVMANILGIPLDKLI